MTVSILPNNMVPTLPFTAVDTKMTVRTWSPDAGIQVRLKVEDGADPTRGSAQPRQRPRWPAARKTLEFDFANEATGTAALNPAYTFDRVSIFFNFGVGAMAGAKTYYLDNLEF